MSKKTQVLTQGLLSGEINGAALQGALENGGFLGAWLSLLQSRDIEALMRSQTALNSILGSPLAIASLAASDDATAALAGSSAAMVAIVSDVNLLNLWNNTPANKTRLQNLINQSGSCLVRYEITAGANWTPPDGALVTASIFMVGGGGNGVSGITGSSGAGGGGGGESKAFPIPGGIPASAQSVTIGNITGPANTVFQGETALTGSSASGSIAGAGAGTTTGAFYDTAALTALWQPTPASRKGGNGGNGSNDPIIPGGTGENGLTGAGGAGGVNGTGGEAGSGLGSGGGGGGRFAIGFGASGLDAGNESYGSGGGGGGAGQNGSGNGGAGRQGVIIVYGVLGAPKA